MSGGGLSIWMAPGAAERLAAQVRHAWASSPVQQERLAAAGLPAGDAAGADGATVSGLMTHLATVPVMRKEDLGPLQAAGRPFGGLLGSPLADLARIFLSPGEIYDPQGRGPDFWRFGTALRAAGFGPGDIVLNCFNYHLSPAGFMFDEAARSVGAVVIPAGVGQMEMQLRVLADTQATAFVGLPSYLLALLQKAAGAGVRVGLKKAFVSAEPLPPTLRAELQGYGVDVCQGYGTADLGLVAYECLHRAGMHLDEGAVVEICDPEGRPVPMGEVGEVVVTLLDPTYPLIRFGTGDLSAMVAEPCPCGRPGLRMRGWLGRSGEAVKVRGMFVYPRQLEEAMARFGAAVVRWQAVVTRDEAHRDRLTVLVDAGPGGAPEPGAVVEAVRAATRLTAEVAVGAVPEGGPRLVDRRVWQ